MDSPRPLKVRCGFWPPDVSSTPFNVSNLWVGPAQIGPIGPADPNDAQLDKDLGNLEVNSPPQTCCFSTAVREYERDHGLQQRLSRWDGLK